MEETETETYEPEHLFLVAFVGAPVCYIAADRMVVHENGLVELRVRSFPMEAVVASGLMAPGTTVVRVDSLINHEEIKGS